MVASTSVEPRIWLFYTASGGGNGYCLEWNSTGYVYLYKVTAGVYTVEADGVITESLDASSAHNLEFIASQTVSGTVTLSGILDGILMVTLTMRHRHTQVGLSLHSLLTPVARITSTLRLYTSSRAARLRLHR